MLAAFLGGWTCLVLASVGGCGASRAAEPVSAAEPTGEILRLRTELDGARAEIAALEAERDRLRIDLKHAQARLGLAPFEPSAIRRAEDRYAFAPGPAQRVEAVGARPVKDSLEKVGRGRRAYVVGYWATWCKPCTSPEELTAIRGLRRDLEAMGSTFVSVAIDGLDKVRNDERASTWVYPLWQRDDAHLEWLPERFVRKVGVSLPLFLVVSGEGDILYWHARALDEGATRDLLTAAVAPRR